MVPSQLVAKNVSDAKTSALSARTSWLRATNIMGLDATRVQLPRSRCRPPRQGQTHLQSEFVESMTGASEVTKVVIIPSCRLNHSYFVRRLAVLAIAGRGEIAVSEDRHRW